MNRNLTSFYWDAAEGAKRAGQYDVARQLWRMITERAPANAIEVGFAKSRLEERQTEFEQLWQR